MNISTNLIYCRIVWYYFLLYIWFMLIQICVIDIMWWWIVVVGIVTVSVSDDERDCFGYGCCYGCC